MLLITFLIPGNALGAHACLESWYQTAWCDAHAGKREILMPDGSRCDCVTVSHAIEIEFAVKWAEAIGQALFYSLQTGKRGGIVLIVERDSELRFWIRLNSTIQHFGLPLDTWMVGYP